MQLPPYPPALVIGASRGLGLALTKHLAKTRKVYATVRSPPKPGLFPEEVVVIKDIDVSKDCGSKLTEGLKEKVGQVWMVAGLLKTETFKEPSWQDEIDMYTTCAIAPVFLINALVFNNSLAENPTIMMITSEGGSITLRIPEESGMFGHHASKAANNMIARILSFDLARSNPGSKVVAIHPGFLITDMTRDGGMEDDYEKGGAIKPEVSAPVLVDFADNLTEDQAGKFWAPHGAKGIGNVEAVMGKEALKIKPLELPW